MKGHRWLDGKAWWEVTRDERYFCAELFFLARAKLAGFVAYLNREHAADLDPAAHWELAYEAVFYRDLWQARGKEGELFSPKRTFDLALFSSDDILIIEAKAQQGFATKQLEEFKEDAEEVGSLTGARRVRLAALVSSRYTPKQTTLAYFDGPILRWKELADLYGGDPKLQRADDLFGRG